MIRDTDVSINKRRREGRRERQRDLKWLALCRRFEGKGNMNAFISKYLHSCLYALHLLIVDSQQFYVVWTIIILFFTRAKWDIENLGNLCKVMIVKWDGMWICNAGLTWHALYHSICCCSVATLCDFCNPRDCSQPGSSDYTCCFVLFCFFVSSFWEQSFFFYLDSRLLHDCKVSYSHNDSVSANY